MPAATLTLSGAGKAYVGAVVAAGTVLIVLALIELSTGQTPPHWLLLAALTLLSGPFSIRVPSTRATISIAETFVFASVVLFGVAPATLTVAIDSLLASRTGRGSRNPYRLAFNVTEGVVSVWVAAQVFYLLTGASPLFSEPMPAEPLLVPLFLMTTMFFALNGGLQMLAVWFERDIRLTRLFEDYLPHLAVTYFATFCLVVLLVLNLENLGFAAVAVLVPVLVLSYASSKLARDRSETQAALRESETRLRELSRHISEVLWMVDADTGRALYVSPAYERVWGRSLEGVHDPDFDWTETIQMDDRARVREALADLGSGATFDIEYRVERPDGRVRWIHHRGIAVDDSDGGGRRLAGVAEDITGRRRLERELLQARKMEGIGRLAGGLAHDFNNILTAILGYSDLVLAGAKKDSDVARAGREIEVAAERAAALTRQLLAFGRQQMLRLEVLDLNAIVRGLEYMMQRLIGEDIVVETLLADDLANVKADKSQLEQVLVNLAANARDAMPTGGTLTIATTNVVRDRVEPAQSEMPAGRFVALVVTDTGAGMDDATRARIFEPFFTRKPSGKGSGLGLATVYGTVKQLGGYIYVESQINRGSSFTVYLPQTAERPHPHVVAPIAEPVPHGGGTVLLVEDEAAVRAFVATVLARAGYHVLEASTPRDAIAIEEGLGDPIHLLLTDVVMPQMDGHELATRLRLRRAEVRVLFMSAYGADAISDRGVVDFGHASVLAKPFTARMLLEAVRRVIERSPTTRVPADVGGR